LECFEGKANTLSPPNSFLPSILNMNGFLDITFPSFDSTFDPGALPPTLSIPSEVFLNWCPAGQGSRIPSSSYGPSGSHLNACSLTHHVVSTPTLPSCERVPSTPYPAAILTTSDKSTFPLRHVVSCSRGLSSTLCEAGPLTGRYSHRTEHRLYLGWFMRR
jgi:hypothetical protein